LLIRIGDQAEVAIIGDPAIVDMRDDVAGGEHFISGNVQHNQPRSRWGDVLDDVMQPAKNFGIFALRECGLQVRADRRSTTQQSTRRCLALTIVIVAELLDQRA
jgi:hypothetical protein